LKQSTSGQGIEKMDGQWIPEGSERRLGAKLDKSLVTENGGGA